MTSLKMLNYAVLISFAISAFADVPCCKEKVRSTTYLDIAVDLISKVKSWIPECKENKDCPKQKATDCADWYEKGYNKSGVYTIWPINRLTSNKSLDVFCDMNTDGGGWTVIQRRGNFSSPNDYFYKNWTSYKEGFGNNNKDFWIGNDNIFALTNQKLYTIRFDLQDNNDLKGYAKYSDFWIDDEANKYTLHIFNYSGNAGDSMGKHNNNKFTTKDQKNDIAKENCAQTYKGAWWFDNCFNAHLNGLYNGYTEGIRWDGWTKYSDLIAWTEMKIRPKSFTPISVI